MAIKAIALDIDGTLTNDQKVVTPRTKETLFAAQRAGIRVILASGRPVQGLRALARELELDRYHGLLVAYTARTWWTPRATRASSTSPWSPPSCASSWTTCAPSTSSPG